MVAGSGNAEVDREVGAGRLVAAGAVDIHGAVLRGRRSGDTLVLLVGQERVALDHGVVSHVERDGWAGARNASTKKRSIDWPSFEDLSSQREF